MGNKKDMRIPAVRNKSAHASTAPGGYSGVSPVVIAMLGFTLAAASFVGAGLFADSRLGSAVELTHSVSDNAMPSLVHIGAMRRELADLHLMLERAAEGRSLDPFSLNEHVRELEAASRGYESMPQFAAEPEVWARARPMIDEVRLVVAQVVADVNAGALAAAQAQVAQKFAAAEVVADAALIELRRINLEAGTRAARKADWAWTRARHVSFLLDLACAGFTAGLALLALRRGRQYMRSEARRIKELDAFAARVAHDIRGPLTPPQIALQALLRDLDADSPHRANLERGLRGLQRADVLVRDLLMFARASAAPETDAHALLPDVVEGVLQDIERQASDAQVRVDVADLPTCDVHCAPGVLSSIVENLVGNAIKYIAPEAKERQVCIRAFEAANRVHVEVSDTGRGLPEGAEERIFDPYVRADTSSMGLGLGLATVKRLVQAHGGSVGVQSRLGSGSVFWFELPCDKQAPGA